MNHTALLLLPLTMRSQKELWENRQFCKSGHKYWAVGTWKLRRVLRWHPEVARDISDDKVSAALISTCQHSWAPLYQTAQLLKKGIGKIFPNKSESHWKHTRSWAIFLKTSKSLKGYILHMRFEVPSSSISLHVKLPNDCVALSVWSGAFHTRKLGVW